MKRNAIARIIIFSIVIFILIGILATALISDLFSFRNPGSFRVDLFSSSEGGTISSQGTVSADSVSNICVEWVAGNIRVIPGDTDQIIFEEYGAKNDDEIMVWKQTGNQLTIQYCKDTVNFDIISFGVDIDYSKDLTITVPSSWICKELEIDSASAELEITGLTLKEVDVNTASGTIFMDQCEVEELSIETVSGDVDFTGSITTLSCNGVSANCEINAMNVPKSIEMEGVSGNLDLWIAEDCGFNASIETVSGRFSSDFATTTQNGNYVYGDGACRIEMEGVSGDINIHKLSTTK